MRSHWQPAYTMEQCGAALAIATVAAKGGPRNNQRWDELCAEIAKHAHLFAPKSPAPPAPAPMTAQPEPGRALDRVLDRAPLAIYCGTGRPFYDREDIAAARADLAAMRERVAALEAENEKLRVIQVNARIAGLPVKPSHILPRGVVWMNAHDYAEMKAPTVLNPE